MARAALLAAHPAVPGRSAAGRVAGGAPALLRCSELAGPDPDPAAPLRPRSSSCLNTPQQLLRCIIYLGLSFNKANTLSGV